MSAWKSVAPIVAFALVQPAAAQGQVNQLTLFQSGQVASAAAVNDNFKTLLAQTVKMQRPAFLRKLGAPQRIVIPATTNKPGRVAIGNEVLSFTQNIEIDLTASGRGGIDKGNLQGNTLYYVYVVFGSGGPPAVAATASMNSPEQVPTSTDPPGPVGFGTNWTYLGSMLTDASPSPQVLPFRFDRGQYSTWGDATPEVNTNATVFTGKDLKVPAFASSIYGRFDLSGSVAAGDQAEAGPESSFVLTFDVLRASSTIAPIALASIPLFEPSRIYLRVTNGSTNLNFRLLSWTEDPTQFQ